MSSDYSTENVENRIRSGRSLIFQELKQNPTLALTGCYLVVSAIGLAFNWQLLMKFGVNFLFFADITDFMMAAIRRPISIVVFLVTVFSIFLGVFCDLWLRKRWNAYDRLFKYRLMGQLGYSPWSLLLVVILCSGMYIFLFADYQAEKIKNGEGLRYEIRLNSPANMPATASGDNASETSRVGFILLETTARWVFLYDDSAQKVHIIPHENILELIPSPKARTPEKMSSGPSPQTPDQDKKPAPQTKPGESDAPEN